MEEMERGDIVLVRKPGLFNRIIELFVGRPIGIAISSVALILPESIYGANLVTINCFSEYTILRYKLTFEELDIICGHILNRINKKYPCSQWSKLALRLKYIFKSRIFTQNQWICSDLIKHAFEAAGICLLPAGVYNYNNLFKAKQLSHLEVQSYDG
jgi:hypothetical protein